MTDAEKPETVACTECGRAPRAGERGWRAYLTVDDEVAVYCPRCAEREFGQTGPPGERRPGA